MKREKESTKRDTKRRHQAFKEVQNTCPLCNDQLTIRVESYLENDMLREEASCPTCQILTRVKNHKMH
jgi:transcription elongation factor Elf1